MGAMQIYNYEYLHKIDSIKRKLMYSMECNSMNMFIIECELS